LAEGPLLSEILDQTDRVGAKSPIFNLFSTVALDSHMCHFDVLYMYGLIVLFILFSSVDTSHVP